MRFNDAQERINKTQEYNLTETGLYHIEASIGEDGEPSKKFVYIANGAIVAIKDIVRDDGTNAPDKKLILQAITHNKTAPEVELSYKDLSPNSITTVGGLLFRPAMSRNARGYIIDSILAQEPFVEQHYYYQHLGFRHINGSLAFLHSGGGINSDGVETELQGRLSRYCFSDDNTENHFDYINRFLSVAPHHITLPLLSLAALCPLNEFLRESGIEPGFIVFLSGRTGTRKSTLAALLLSFFGDFDNKTLPCSTRDTMNSIEKTLSLTKDVLTVVDDFYPSSNRYERDNMEKVAQGIVRAVGDRTGRKRLNVDGTLRASYIPRGNVLATGEDTLPGVGQSGEARVISLELLPEDVDLKALTDVQKNRTCLNECMRDYIQWLIPLANELPGKLLKRFTKYRDEFQTNGHGRIAEAVAHLQIGFEMFTEFLKVQSVYTEDEVKSLRSENIELLTGIAEKQNQTAQQEKPSLLFIEALREMLATQAVKLASLDTPTLYKRYIGWRDEKFAYLRPDTAYNEVCSMYRQYEKTFPITKRTLLKHLCTDKLILPSTQDGSVTSPTITKRIGGNVTRVLCIPLDLLENDTEEETI